MRVGDLVGFSEVYAKQGLLRGYDSFPGEYGYHTVVWVDVALRGIVVQIQDNFNKVFVGGKFLWFDEHLLRRVQ